VTRLPRGTVTVDLVDLDDQLLFFDIAENPITSLTFDSTAPQTILVKAKLDGQREGLHHGQIGFDVRSAGDIDVVRTGASDTFTIPTRSQRGTWD